MLRVLHCIYDDPGNPWLGGGGSRRVGEIYRRLGGRVEATVATGNYPGARDETVEGVRYLRLGAESPYPWSRWTFAREATRLLAGGEYDAAVYDYSLYTPVRLPEGRPVGVVVHMLQGPTARGRWGRLLGAGLERLERRLLGQSRSVCVTSRWLAERIRSLVPGVEPWVIGSGVDDSFFALPRGEGSLLLYYGRFDVFQKGLDLLLEAFSPLSAARPDLRLVLAGRGRDADRLASMAADRGLSGRVEVVAEVTPEQRDRLFERAALLAMPSRLEGLPMVPAEAMAAGVPVVATDVGALREVVRPPEGGILVPPEDPVALADVIRELLEDGERRRAIGASARASAQRFRWDSVAQQHLEFLHSIAESTTTPRQPS